MGQAIGTAAMNTSGAQVTGANITIGFMELIPVTANSAKSTRRSTVIAWKWNRAGDAGTNSVDSIQHIRLALELRLAARRGGNKQARLTV